MTGQQPDRLVALELVRHRAGMLRRVMAVTAVEVLASGWAAGRTDIVDLAGAVRILRESSGA